jgi:hypothetical protein
MQYDDRKIFHRKDIHIADWLMSFRDKLVEEYLAYHPDYDTTFSKSSSIHNPGDVVYPNWKIDTLKNVLLETNTIYSPDNHPNPDLPSNLPTASHIARELGHNCIMLSYSTMEPGTAIPRHYDESPYTKANEVRIHVPLIIPEGEVWLEVEGSDIEWTDIFAFSTLHVHSAYNRTNKRRLILILDVKRKFLNLLPASPFNRERADIERMNSYEHVTNYGTVITAKLDGKFNLLTEEKVYIGEKNGNG